MRLPPLNALRAFEAAARHEGFIGASDELHVTRGAISRHVKQLEDHLGVTLFTRHARGVTLTDAGRRLLPVLTNAFDQIMRETRRITADAATLRIVCPPATSIRWLIPRLDSFRATHPEIDLRLTTDFFLGRGLLHGDHDIGFSLTNWPARPQGLEVQTLFPVHLTPACAPSLLGGKTRLSSPEKLAEFTILHEVPRRLDWPEWIEGFGITSLDPGGGQDFPNLDMATKAAVMGQGVVMADLVLCREELAAGTLIAPLPDMVCKSRYGGVCLVGRPEQWDDPKIKAFRDWAMDSAEGDRAFLNGST